MEPKLSIVGLGKLGAPMLACFASRGYSVNGIDVNRSFVEQLGQHQAPHQEPLLQDLLSEHKALIKTTHLYRDIVQDSDVTFIIVPTPSTPEGGFSNEYVKAAAAQLAQELKGKDKWHLFVITSTVLPGSVEKDILPVFESISGKKAGRDFGLCYSPLFIALGSVVKNILSPDFVLIGESDPKSGALLESIYNKVTQDKADICRMNWVNAELAKIAVNSYVTLKISFANQLAEICESLPGANSAVITQAVGRDTRIGRKYLQGALGFGGPCFPRDNKAFSYVATQVGARAPLAEVTDVINQRQPDRIFAKAIEARPGLKKVAVLGLAYKPDTPVIEASQGILIAQKFLNHGYKVSAYDPLAATASRAILGSEVSFSSSVEECIAEADVIVITLPLDDFRPLPKAFNKDQRPFIIDCWGILKDTPLQEVAEYHQVGCHI